MEVKGKGEKKRYVPLNAEFQRTEKGDKKPFQSDQCKEIEGEKKEWERPSKKLKIPRETFMQRWAQ